MLGDVVLKRWAFVFAQIRADTLYRDVNGGEWPAHGRVGGVHAHLGRPGQALLDDCFGGFAQRASYQQGVGHKRCHAAQHRGFILAGTQTVFLVQGLKALGRKCAILRHGQLVDLRGNHLAAHYGLGHIATLVLDCGLFSQIINGFQRHVHVITNATGHVCANIIYDEISQCPGLSGQRLDLPAKFLAQLLGHASHEFRVFVFWWGRIHAERLDESSLFVGLDIGSVSDWVFHARKRFAQFGQRRDING